MPFFDPIGGTNAPQSQGAASLFGATQNPFALATPAAGTPVDDEGDVLGTQTTRDESSKRTSPLAQTAALPTAKGWQFFGVLWYWWLAGVAAIAALWWLLAARRRRAQQDA